MAYFYKKSSAFYLPNQNNSIQNQNIFIRFNVFTSIVSYNTYRDSANSYLL